MHTSGPPRWFTARMYIYMGRHIHEWSVYTFGPTREARLPLMKLLCSSNSGTRYYERLYLDRWAYTMPVYTLCLYVCGWRKERQCIPRSRLVFNARVVYTYRYRGQKSVTSSDAAAADDDGGEVLKPVIKASRAHDRPRNNPRHTSVAYADCMCAYNAAL